MSKEMPPPGGQEVNELPFKAVNLYIGAGPKFDNIDPSFGKSSVVAFIQGEIIKDNKKRILWIIFLENSDHFGGVTNYYEAGSEYSIIYSPSILLSEVLNTIKEKRKIFVVDTRNTKPGFNIGFFLKCSLISE